MLEVCTTFELRDLGLMRYADALAVQRDLMERRKRGEIPDQLLIVEHPHVITMGRNGHSENVLAAPEILERAGIEFYSTDRGGDVTYHGPGQVVGYPIFDLREWKRDVGAYLRAMEQALIETLAGFGIEARRSEGATGVWCDKGKIAAMGVHISRWVTSHGFALNVETDLDYFKYIVPCRPHQTGDLDAGDGMSGQPSPGCRGRGGFFRERVRARSIKWRLHDWTLPNAPDGREHCRRSADQMAVNAGRPSPAG